MSFRVIYSFSDPDHRPLSKSMCDLGCLPGRIFRFAGIAFAAHIGGSFIRALFDVFFG